jgi:hypothetical protein
MISARDQGMITFLNEQKHVSGCMYTNKVTMRPKYWMNELKKEPDETLKYD